LHIFSKKKVFSFNVNVDVEMLLLVTTLMLLLIVINGIIDNDKNPKQYVTPNRSFLDIRLKCKTDPLSFTFYHFSPLSFKYSQFSHLLNFCYVLPFTNQNDPVLNDFLKFLNLKKMVITKKKNTKGSGTT